MCVEHYSRMTRVWWYSGEAETTAIERRPAVGFTCTSKETRRGSVELSNTHNSSATKGGRASEEETFFSAQETSLVFNNGAARPAPRISFLRRRVQGTLVPQATPGAVKRR